MRHLVRPANWFLHILAVCINPWSFPKHNQVFLSQPNQTDLLTLCKLHSYRCVKCHVVGSRQTSWFQFTLTAQKALINPMCCMLDARQQIVAKVSYLAASW